MKKLGFYLTTSQKMAFYRFVDDSHGRFKTLEDAKEFQKLLNNQDTAIQYTMETENDKKELNFLDVTII